MSEVIGVRYGRKQASDVVKSLIERAQDFWCKTHPHEIREIFVEPKTTGFLPHPIGPEILADKLAKSCNSLSITQVSDDTQPTYLDFEMVVECHDEVKGTAGTFTGIRITVLADDEVVEGWYFAIEVNDEVSGWDEETPVPADHLQKAFEMLDTFQNHLKKVTGTDVKVLRESCSHDFPPKQVAGPIKVILGQDYPAYTEFTIDVAEGESLTNEQIIAKVREKASDCLFEPDWSNPSALRILTAHDQNGDVLLEDRAIEPSPFDAGQALQLFLKGKISIEQLVDQAANSGLVDIPIVEKRTGTIVLMSGEEEEIAYQVRKGANQAEIDHAILSALAQKVSFN